MCNFCNDLKELKQIDKEPLLHIDGKRTYYRLALVSVDFIKGQKKGTTTYKSKPFKYCPECGKRM